MHKLTILGAIHPDGMALLAPREDIAVSVVDHSLAPRDEIAEAITGTNAICVRTAVMDGDLLALAPDLKILSRHGVGCDSVDVAHLTARGIPVAISIGGNDRSVAERTLAMMLGLANDFDRQTDFVRRADWSVRGAYRGFDLDERTLLIAGFGRIGRRVAELALAFDMSVLVYDPFVDDLPDRIEGVASLEEGLARADFVSIHVPKTSRTSPLIGAAALAAMKPGAMLVNCARGGICDEAAVAEALHSGHLGGYGCDVYTEEPAGLDNPILAAPNTILTPHTASMSPQSMRRMAMIAIQNIIDCLDGCLNPEMVFNRRELGL